MADDRFRLAREIITLSIADSWDLAKTEWTLTNIWFAEDEPETCLCGHYPIVEVCGITNTENGNYTEVGNVCVNKFLGIPSKIVFDGIKRVQKDETKALNEAAYIHAFKQNWINDWELNFCRSTAKKRELSQRQIESRRKINRKVLRMMRRSGG